MPDGDDGTVFSADIDGVRFGGVKLERLSTILGSIAGDLRIPLNKYPDLSGDGDDDISKALKARYKPAEEGGLSFLDGLGDLLDIHGNKTYSLGGLFDDVNTTSTDQAGGVPGHRR
jgi:hypothetical protein